MTYKQQRLLVAFLNSKYIIMITVFTINSNIPELSQTNNNTYSLNIPNLTIATHNVRSFTNTAKQHYLLSLYSSYNIDIIGLQETNFKQQNAASFNPTHSQYFLVQHLDREQPLESAL